MSTGWSLFIIAGTLGSLGWALWLLFANKKMPSGPVKTTGHDFDGIEEYDNPLPLWWVGLFVVTILFALGYLVYYPGLGNFQGVGNWTSKGQWERDVAAKDAQFASLYTSLAALSPQELKDSRQSQQIGRRLFLNNCSTCHGITARGAFGFPNLTDGEWQWGADFETIKTTLRGGRMAAMAPWGAALGGEPGIADMAQYVLSLSGAVHDAAAAARAAPQFQMFCVACHGPDGKGGPLFGAPDLTNDVWLYGGDADAIAFTLRHGRNGVMPAFAEILGEEKIHILAGYVSGLPQQ
jgi:cytochrome c oxidase cbb3-type subunit III